MFENDLLSRDNLLKSLDVNTLSEFNSLNI